MYCKGSSVTGLAEMKTFSRGTCGSQSEYHTVETMDPKKKNGISPETACKLKVEPSQWGTCLLEGDFTQF